MKKLSLFSHIRRKIFPVSKRGNRQQKQQDVGSTSLDSLLGAAGSMISTGMFALTFESCCH